MPLTQENTRKLYKIPMQENGRVILPAELRKSLGLSKGDKVIIEASDEGITITTARIRRKRAQEIAAQYTKPGINVVDEYLSEKRAEAGREINAIEDTDSEDAA